MKRKLAIILVASMAICLAPACGKKGNEPSYESSSSGKDALGGEDISSSSSSSGSESDTMSAVGSIPDEVTEPIGGVEGEAKDVDMNQVNVTFNNGQDYKGLTLVDPPKAQPTADADDLPLQQYRNALDSGTISPDKYASKKKKAESGDMVNIDYSGSCGGESFAGSDGWGVSVELGKGLLDMKATGFEAEIVGMKPGESKTLALKFPQTYFDSAYAGQAVKFKVTLNYIYPGSIDDLPDDGVKALAKATGLPYKNGKEMAAFAKNALEYHIYDQYEIGRWNTVIAALDPIMKVDNIPDSLIEQYRLQYRQLIDKYARQDLTDAETYCQVNFGMSFDEKAQSVAEMSAKTYIMFKYISDLENLTISEDEFNKLVDERIAGMGYGSLEDLSKNELETRETLRETFMYYKVTDFIYDNGKVKKSK